MTITPREFVDKWRASELKESSASQEHFIDLCRLLDEPTPAEADPKGESYCFERGARKDTGTGGWADVWKQGCFGWEYKGKDRDLDKAYDQLRQYAPALDNPPLLIVSDMERFRIRTNWTNTVSEVHEFDLDGLLDPENRNLLKWAMSDPEQLRPGKTRSDLTVRAAEAFAPVAQALRDRGHDPPKVARFVNRMVFCMFAEDVGLLPDRMFTRMLEVARADPSEFSAMASNLFGAMATGGLVGFDRVACFNGGLFEDGAALPLERADIETTLEAANLEWAEIDPSILGTLFERGLDPSKRSQLGAHYTDRDKIMRIVDPVIVRPWLAEWEAARGEIEEELERADARGSKSARTRLRDAAERRYREFLAGLRAFSVLDPACGSGNFLYLALQALKDLEHRIQLEAEALGLQRGFPEVGPANVLGIEINPYAAELARTSVRIGLIQWNRTNGFPHPVEPILQETDAIECRDAIVNPDGTEPEWPEANVVIGNPPFLGGKLLRDRLGSEYVSRMFGAYEGRVPKEADLVTYWFVKAGLQVEAGQTKRVGLVATNSIRGGANRRALQTTTEGRPIFEAWSDQPWVVEGAAVRVSLVCFGESGHGPGPARRLDGKVVDEVHTDLTATRGTAGVDLTKACRLERNQGVAFMGDTKGGAFDVPGDLAREWLGLPANPHGRPNSEVLKPWVNGMDLTRRPSGKWIVDFGWTMEEQKAALYEEPFRHVEERVRPVREKNRRKAYRKWWWRHVEPRPAMWNALEGLSRCIATPMVAKHRLFIWLDSRVCPDHQLIVVARDDDVTFGVLHSRFHEAWALRLGTSLESRPRYTLTSTFETFPFPLGLSPDIPASASADDPQATAIGDAARRLVELRDRWLNPPEWVEWVEEPAGDYPARPVPRDAEAAKQLKSRTLTNLYNDRPTWLDQAHRELDAAVAAAYGWPADVSEEEALRALLELNERAKE